MQVRESWRRTKLKGEMKKKPTEEFSMHYYN